MAQLGNIAPWPWATVRRQRPRFATVHLAMLHHPPTHPPNGQRTEIGEPCWRGIATVYSCGSGAGSGASPPSTVGAIRVYASEFSMLDAKVAAACKILKGQERSRGNRLLRCGEPNVALVSAGLNDGCTGAFFLDYADARPKLKKLM